MKQVSSLPSGRSNKCDKEIMTKSIVTKLLAFLDGYLQPSNGKMS